MRGLAKDPAMRFQTAPELLDALHQAEVREGLAEGRDAIGRNHKGRRKESARARYAARDCALAQFAPRSIFISVVATALRWRPATPRFATSWSCPTSNAYQ